MKRARRFEVLATVSSFHLFGVVESRKSGFEDVSVGEMRIDHKFEKSSSRKKSKLNYEVILICSRKEVPRSMR